VEECCFSLFESSPRPIWIIDRETLAFLTVNRAAVRAYGYAREEFLSLSLPDILHPEEMPQLLASLAQPGPHLMGPVRQLTKDGKIIFAEVTANNVVFRGRPARLCLINDITEYKRALEDLYHSSQEFRVLVENSPDVIVRVERDLRVAYVSPAVTTVTGLTPDHYTGRTVREALVDDAVADLVEAGLRRVFETGETVVMEHEYPTLAGLAWFEARFVPQPNPAGGVLAVIGLIRDITERKRLEELRESEGHFRLALKNSPVIVFNQDRDLRYTWIYNPRSNVPAGEVVGKTDAELLAPEDAAELTRIKRGVLESGTGVREEVGITVNGERVYYNLTVEPLRDFSGEVIGITCAAVDITKRKRMELALQESESRYREIMENAADAIFVADGQTGVIIDANQQAANLLGIPREEIIGMHQTELHPSEEAEFYAREFREAVLRQGRMDKVYVVQRRDGARIPVQISAAVSQLGGRTIVQGLFRNLGERRRVEAALHESETRFRQLADNIDEVYWITDAKRGKVVYLSPAFERVWGMSREYVYEHPTLWREAVLPEDAPVIRAATEKQLRGEAVEIEFRIRRPDGVVRWVRARSFPVSGRREEAFIYGIAEDITTRKQAEEERLAYAVGQRDTLVREVHHRIKNHLQGVAGLLRQHAGQYPELKTFMDEAISQVQAVAVVHGLQGKTRQSEGVGLCDMVQAIVNAVKDLTKASITPDIQVDQTRHLSVVEGEAVALALILNELVLNAVKHSPGDAGDKQICVELGGGGATGRVRIFNRGSLRPEFDFRGGVGCGVGLELVRSLLPPRGADLRIAATDGGVETVLELAPPVIAVNGG
jgi:PAS domain S-box-containing protein